MIELLSVLVLAFAAPVLIWAGWFGWNLGLAAGGSKRTDAWRLL